jgi:hypothetical protein
MNIETVASNLRNTIAGKEELLVKRRQELEDGDCYSDSAHLAIIRLLQINIDELKRILQDVEQCAKQQSDDSWITNPDRMGGQYTEEEINRGSEWR